MVSNAGSDRYVPDIARFAVFGVPILGRSAQRLL